MAASASLARGFSEECSTASVDKHAGAGICRQTPDKGVPRRFATGLVHADHPHQSSRASASRRMWRRGMVPCFVPLKGPRRWHPIRTPAAAACDERTAEPSPPIRKRFAQITPHRCQRLSLSRSRISSSRTSWRFGAGGAASASALTCLSRLICLTMKKITKAMMMKSIIVLMNDP